MTHSGSNNFIETCDKSVQLYKWNSSHYIVVFSVTKMAHWMGRIQLDPLMFALSLHQDNLSDQK